MGDAIKERRKVRKRLSELLESYYEALMDAARRESWERWVRIRTPPSYLKGPEQTGPLVSRGFHSYARGTKVVIKKKRTPSARVMIRAN
jgi:hypothetical protein